MEIHIRQHCVSHHSGMMRNFKVGIIILKYILCSRGISYQGVGIKFITYKTKSYALLYVKFVMTQSPLYVSI